MIPKLLHTYILLWRPSLSLQLGCIFDESLCSLYTVYLLDAKLEISPTSVLSNTIKNYKIKLYYRVKISLLLETHRRRTCLIVEDQLETLIGDRHAPSIVDPTCLIGNRHAISIVDRHALLQTNMPYRRPTCLILCIPTCLIGDQPALSETDMPHQRPKCLIGDWRASSETNMPNRRPTCLIWDS